MSKRLKTLKAVVDFFVDNGQVMDQQTYRDTRGRPFNPVVLKRVIGSWSRVIQWGDKYYPELMEDARSGKTVAKVAAAVTTAKVAEAAKAAEAARAAAETFNEE